MEFMPRPKILIDPRVGKVVIMIPKVGTEEKNEKDIETMIAIIDLAIMRENGTEIEKVLVIIILFFFLFKIFSSELHKDLSFVICI